MNAFDLDPNYGLPLWVSSESYERLRRESAGGPAGEAGRAACREQAGTVTQEPSGLALEEEKDMNDATPKVNYWFAIWISLVRYFRAYPPLVQESQQLELPLTSGQLKACVKAVKQYLPKELGEQRQLRTTVQDSTGGPAGGAGCIAGKVTQEPSVYLAKDLIHRLPVQPSP
ncbi:MAG: hypothetical protein ACHQAU_03845 [Gammaproteobacteria bacterium]